MRHINYFPQKQAKTKVIWVKMETLSELRGGKRELRKKRKESFWHFSVVIEKFSLHMKEGDSMSKREIKTRSLIHEVLLYFTPKGQVLQSAALSDGCLPTFSLQQELRFEVCFQEEDESKWHDLSDERQFREGEEGGKR